MTTGNNSKNEKEREKVLKAVKWISENAGLRDREQLIEEASLRFDLSPRDEELLRATLSSDNT